MSTTINHTFTQDYQSESLNVSRFKKFMNWCEGQEKNRLLWLGVSLTAHGCIITPITVMVVLLAGTNMFLFILALVSMGLSLVTNLAAMPTRITIPVFVFSILIDLIIIFSCVFIGFDITKTYI